MTSCLQGIPPALRRSVSSPWPTAHERGGRATREPPPPATASPSDDREADRPGARPARLPSDTTSSLTERGRGAAALRSTWSSSAQAVSSSSTPRRGPTCSIQADHIFRGQEDVTDDLHVARRSRRTTRRRRSSPRSGSPPARCDVLAVLAGRHGIDESVGPRPGRRRDASTSAVHRLRTGTASTPNQIDSCSHVRWPSSAQLNAPPPVNTRRAGTGAVGPTAP